MKHREKGGDDGRLESAGRRGKDIFLRIDAHVRGRVKKLSALSVSLAPSLVKKKLIIEHGEGAAAERGKLTESTKLGFAFDVCLMLSYMYFLVKFSFSQSPL